MSRKRARVSFLVLFSMCLSFFSPPLPRALGATAKPNVILLLMDDLSGDMFDAALASEITVNGARKPVFPNFRSLVADGVYFKNNYVTNAVCCPSRATALTGQYTHNHGILNVATGLKFWLGEDGTPRAKEAKTIAPWMKAAGYFTGHIGKYLNGYGAPGYTLPTYVPPGYDEWHGTVDFSTYRMYEYYFNNNGRIAYHGNLPGDYQTDVISDKAADFLTMSAKQPASPFFLVLTPVAPHVEESDDLIIALLSQLNLGGLTYRKAFEFDVRPAPRHLYLADGNLANGEIGDPLSLPKASFNEADVFLSQKVGALANAPTLDEKTIENMKRQWKRKLASMKATDDMLGRLEKQLREQGKWDNTTILLTGDNGYFFGEHRRSEKQIAYEESIRVPLVVRGPGVLKGVTRTETSLNIDLAPTIAELGQATPTAVVDGRSLVGLLKNGQFPWARKQFLVEHFLEVNVNNPAIQNGLEVSNPPTLQAIRRRAPGQDTLYVQWFEGLVTSELADPRNLGVGTFFEFYNMTGEGGDKAQLFNVLNPGALNPPPAFVPNRSGLETLTSQFARCAGAECRNLENQ